MRVTLTVCNVCKDPGQDTRQYELKEGARKVKIDLCPEHAVPFEGFLDLEPPPAPVTTGRGRRAPAARSPRVTTIEEIERMKAAKKA